MANPDGQRAQPEPPDTEQAAVANLHDTDDDVALRSVAFLLDRAEPQPPSIVALGLEAWAWRDPDAQLAQLVHDSLTASAAGTGLRSATPAVAATRELGYQLDDGDAVIDIDIQIEQGRDGATLIGQISGDDAVGEVELLSAGSSGGPGLHLVARADALGRFRFERVRATTARLKLSSEGRSRLTPWFTL